MAKSRSINVNGSTVHVLEAGREHARSILLIHGGFGDARLNWGDVIDILAESFHVIAPDLPGFGDSDALPELTLKRLNEWTWGVLEALDVQQAVIVGSSIGGALARLFAAESPHLVPAVVLVDGGGIPTFSRLMRTIARMPVLSTILMKSLGRVACGTAILKDLFHDEALLTESLTAELKKSGEKFSQLVRPFVCGEAPDNSFPQMPTLLIWGVYDKIAPMKEGEKLQQQLSGARLIQIDNCGHLPQIEAPDVFAFQLKEFLERISRPAAHQLPGVGMLNPARVRNNNLTGN